MEANNSYIGLWGVALMIKSYALLVDAFHLAKVSLFPSQGMTFGEHHLSDSRKMELAIV
jgi:hypothetical protein